MQGPARTTFSTTLSTEYLLTSFPEHVPQKDIANVVLLDHQLIYCNDKVIRPRAYKFKKETLVH